LLRKIFFTSYPLFCLNLKVINHLLKKKKKKKKKKYLTTLELMNLLF